MAKIKAPAACPRMLISRGWFSPIIVSRKVRRRSQAPAHRTFCAAREETIRRFALPLSYCTATDAEDQQKAESTRTKGGHRAVPLRRIHCGIHFSRAPLYSLAPIRIRPGSAVLRRPPGCEHGEPAAGGGGRSGKEAQSPALPLRVPALRGRLPESP